MIKTVSIILIALLLFCCDIGNNYSRSNNKCRYELTCEHYNNRSFFTDKEEISCVSTCKSSDAGENEDDDCVRWVRLLEVDTDIEYMYITLSTSFESNSPQIKELKRKVRDYDTNKWIR